MIDAIEASAEPMASDDLSTSVDSSVPALPNLLDYHHDKLSAWLTAQQEPAYRAGQILHWIHQRGVADIEAMTNLSKTLRLKLKAHFMIRFPAIAKTQLATDGCVKWLLRLADGNVIEVVYIPDVKTLNGVTRRRATLCISSQAGCSLNCTFCATGKQGFNRNLSFGEIIGQLWLARDYICQQMPAAPRISNVVFMGMGEPLLNYDAVVAAAKLMLDDKAYGLSKYKVTISTSGVLPAMKRLQRDCEVSLALSLHAACDSIRDVIVPINKKYSLAPLIEFCKSYFRLKQSSLQKPAANGRLVLMEYVMLAGVNDQPKHADQLVRLLRDVPCKINLIPFNPFPGAEYQCSSMEVMLRFQRRLMAAGFNVRLRKTRGFEVAAACGQLAGAITDRTGRHAKWKRQMQTS